MAPSTQSKTIGVKSDRILALIIILLSVTLVVRLKANEDSSLTAGGSHSAAVASAQDESTSRPLREPPAVGSPAPAFTLGNLDGQPVSLSHWRGRPVLVNFWATWCGPCELEIPVIQATFEAHQSEGFVVLAIAVDDTINSVRRFSEAHDLTFPILMDDDRVSDVYQVKNIPTSIFIGTDGNVSVVHVGPLTEDSIEAYYGRLN